MPRPSRNLDRLLLAAGRALYPATGCAGLTIRQVCEAAGVNTGMFNYHFGTRERFLRAVMQGAYEEMFASLTLAVRKPAELTAAEALRGALGALGRFALANRDFVARIAADALAGETVARDCLRENLPRHLQVIAGLVAAGAATGEFRPLAPAQAVGFCVGAVAAPVLFGGAVAASGEAPPAFAATLGRTLLTPKALDERIDLVIAGLAAPPSRRKGAT